MQWLGLGTVNLKFTGKSSLSCQGLGRTEFKFKIAGSAAGRPGRALAASRGPASPARSTGNLRAAAAGPGPGAAHWQPEAVNHDVTHGNGSPARGGAEMPCGVRPDAPGLLWRPGAGGPLWHWRPADGFRYPGQLLRI